MLWSCNAQVMHCLNGLYYYYLSILRYLAIPGMINYNSYQLELHNLQWNNNNNKMYVPTANCQLMSNRGLNRRHYRVIQNFIRHCWYTGNKIISIDHFLIVSPSEVCCSTFWAAVACRTYLGKYDEENDDVLVNCMRAAGDNGSCHWP